VTGHRLMTIILSNLNRLKKISKRFLGTFVVHETTTFLLVNLPNIRQLKKLLAIPPHVTYVATLPCNLSLMSGFVEINVSQGRSSICKVR